MLKFPSSIEDRSSIDEGLERLPYLSGIRQLYPALRYLLRCTVGSLQGLWCTLYEYTTDDPRHHSHKERDVQNRLSWVGLRGSDPGEDFFDHP